MIVLVSRIVRSCMLGVVGLGGCASYQHAPLHKEMSLVERASDLKGGGGKRITPAALDRLVAFNNPDLRAARAKLGVGAAQVQQAGILPNPQAGVTYPFFIAGPAVTQDLRSILLLPTKEEVARAAASDISATLLWQEWQTIGKARLLFVQIASGERAKTFIVENRRFLEERFKFTNTAVGQGNVTLATLSPDLVAVGGIQRVYDDLERLQQSRRQQLNALLGLAPEANRALAAATDVPRVEPVAILRKFPCRCL